MYWWVGDLPSTCRGTCWWLVWWLEGLVRPLWLLCCLTFETLKRIRTNILQLYECSQWSSLGLINFIALYSQCLHTSRNTETRYELGWRWCQSWGHWPVCRHSTAAGSQSLEEGRVGPHSSLYHSMIRSQSTYSSAREFRVSTLQPTIVNIYCGWRQMLRWCVLSVLCPVYLLSSCSHHTC